MATATSVDGASLDGRKRRVRSALGVGLTALLAIAILHLTTAGAAGGDGRPSVSFLESAALVHVPVDDRCAGHVVVQMGAPITYGGVITEAGHEKGSWTVRLLARQPTGAVLGSTLDVSARDGHVVVDGREVEPDHVVAVQRGPSGAFGPPRMTLDVERLELAHADLQFVRSHLAGPVEASQ